MGMYDTVRVEYPMPDGTCGFTGQSKDFFDSCMAEHFIRADGALFVDFGKAYDVPKEQRPYPDAPDGSIFALRGCLGWTPRLVEQKTFTGVVSVDDWVFVYLDGKLIGVREYRWYEDDPTQAADIPRNQQGE